MSALRRSTHEAEIGGVRRSLLLRNGEIERFEEHYAPFGVFELLDQLVGRGPLPQVRHCREIVGLGLVGGGMSSRAADDLMNSLPPSENLDLRQIAARLLSETFMPVAPSPPGKKKAAGSRQSKVTAPDDTTPGPASSTSAV